MDDSTTLGISVVVTLVIAAAGYQFLFAKKKLRPGEKPKGTHELEVAIKMGSVEEKCQALRKMSSLYAGHQDVWTAESYIKLAVKVVEESEGMNSPNLIPILNDYADLMKRFGRGGQARELERRSRDISRSHRD